MASKVMTWPPMQVVESGVTVMVYGVGAVTVSGAEPITPR